MLWTWVYALVQYVLCDSLVGDNTGDYGPSQGLPCGGVVGKELSLTLLHTVCAILSIFGVRYFSNYFIYFRYSNMYVVYTVFSPGYLNASSCYLFHFEDITHNAP